MTKGVGMVYEFDSFRLDRANRKLTKSDFSVAITPLAFNTLLFFVENPGRLITKDDLLAAIWPGTHVDESNVPYVISLVRRALGDSGRSQKYIETVAKSGYRFIGDLRWNWESDAVCAAEIKFVIERVQRGYANWKTALALAAGVLVIAVAGSLLLTAR